MEIVFTVSSCSPFIRCQNGGI